MTAGSVPPPLTVLAWDRADAPSVATVTARLRDEGVEPYAWSNGPGDRYAVHEHGYTKLLMCAAGSITFLVGIVVGGLASLSGSVYGALFIQFVPNLADSISKAAPWAVFGVVLIIVMYAIPTGVAGALRRIFPAGRIAPAKA